MAARKKAKTKRSKAKKAKKAKKSLARKKAARKAAKKKVASKKRVKAKAKRTKAKKAKPKKAKKAKAKAKRRTKAKAKSVRRAPSSAPVSPAPARSPIVSLMTPPGDRIGIVTHYFTHLGVAIVQLESGSLYQGDTVHIKGHTSDFRQRIDSMELDHVHVNTAYAGQSVGLRVSEHAREHDVVYKVA